MRGDPPLSLKYLAPASTGTLKEQLSITGIWLGSEERLWPALQCSSLHLHRYHSCLPCSGSGPCYWMWTGRHALPPLGPVTTSSEYFICPNCHLFSKICFFDFCKPSPAWKNKRKPNARGNGQGKHMWGPEITGDAVVTSDLLNCAMGWLKNSSCCCLWGTHGNASLFVMQKNLGLRLPFETSGLGKGARNNILLRNDCWLFFFFFLRPPFTWNQHKPRISWFLSVRWLISKTPELLQMFLFWLW